MVWHVAYLRGLRVPPFTIQRIAEIVLNATCFYSTADRWLFALDKLLRVSSQGVAAGSAEDYEGRCDGYRKAYDSVLAMPTIPRPDDDGDGMS